MVRSIALLSGMVLALGLCRSAWAGQNLGYPYPCPNARGPSAGVYGYFQTTWRQWPGEARPEQTNPRSIGAEVLPTPEGQEQVPLPQGMALPTPSTMPQGIAPPAPAKTAPPPLTPVLPPEPTPEKPSKLPAEGGLPGLPGLPVEPDPMLNPGSSPDLKSPTMPVPKDAVKPTEEGAKKEQSEPKKQPQSKEHSKLQEIPKPASTSKSLSLRWPEHSQPITTTVAFLETQTAARRATRSQGNATGAQEMPASPGTHRGTLIVATAPTSTTERVELAAYTTAEPAVKLKFSDTAVNVPPVALEGYCPVALVHDGRWTLGDLQWTVVYQGRIYRFSSAAARQQFLADPQRYAVDK